MMEFGGRKHLKKNRSNKFTQGIVITNNTNNQRFFFFELDNPFNQEHYTEVCEVYRDSVMDYVNHRTKNGIHFLSPTLLDKEEWKANMNKLKHINKKCPMTTLRWLPNKHFGEREIWYTGESWNDSSNINRNSSELSMLLNKTFGTDFMGTVTTDLKFVRYPLP